MNPMAQRYEIIGQVPNKSGRRFASGGAIAAARTQPAASQRSVAPVLRPATGRRSAPARRSFVRRLRDCLCARPLRLLELHVVAHVLGDPLLGRFARAVDLHLALLLPAAPLGTGSAPAALTAPEAAPTELLLHLTHHPADAPSERSDTRKTSTRKPSTR